KNKQWFKDFENGNYDFLYYVESGHVYYDLVVLKKDDKYNAIPAPIFSKKYMGLEIDGLEVDFGWYERNDIQSYLCEHADYETIDDDEFYDMKEEAKIREENKKTLELLTKEEKEILQEVASNGYILDEE